MAINFSSRAVQWVTLLVLALIWGSSFILMKRALTTYTDLQVAALRIFLAFLAVVPFIWKNLRHLSGGSWFWFLAVGAIGNTVPAFLFTKAQTVLDSSYTGMLNSLTPLFTLLLGLAAFGMKTRWVNAIGILIGLAGALVLVTADGVSSPGNAWMYSFYVIGATMCYAISVNVIKFKLAEYNAVAITALALLFMGPVCGAWLFSTDFTDRVAASPEAMVNLGYVAILGVVGTALAILIFNALIKHTSALFAASVTYLIPIVAIGWGVFDGETIGSWEYLGMAVIMVGVYLVNARPRQQLTSAGEKMQS